VDKQSARPYLKTTHHKNRADGVPQGVGPEFKSQYCKKLINKINKQIKEILMPLLMPPLHLP
jgi:hypothetical protein